MIYEVNFVKKDGYGGLIICYNFINSKDSVKLLNSRDQLIAVLIKKDCKRITFKANNGKEIELYANNRKQIKESFK